MSTSGRVKAHVSSKGQVVIPKLIRDALGFNAGSEIEFVEQADGVLLKRISQTKKYTLDDLLNALPPYEGPKVTDQMMKVGIDAAMQERWVHKEKNSRQ